MSQDLPPWFDKAVAFRQSLDRETDRGCALMAAAYLDTKLEELLRKCFVDDSETADDLLGHSKPLGTFSSRIDLAFLLGHLGKRAHRDIHLVRKIRNDFAHVVNLIDFTHPPIASRCRELHYALVEPNTPPRQCFTNAVFGIFGYVQAAMDKQVHPDQQTDVEITEDLKAQHKALAKRLASYDPDKDKPAA